MPHQSALLDINFTTSQEGILLRLDRLNGSTITETASRIHESAGSSALDAAAWYNMLQKHEEQSTRLANVLAKTAIPTLLTHTEISICESGLIILGSPIGSAEFVQVNEYKKYGEQSALVNGFAAVAVVDPHVAYVAQTISLQARWSFLQRTTPCNSDWFNFLELSILNRLLPKLIGLDNIDDDLQEVIKISTQMD
ncbi:hypothetical protein GJ496_010260 [Pomphorhynchus laevis]|nr:hypothetical protein GJ496_010260 [Pomphorhynchus laevis]